MNKKIRLILLIIPVVAWGIIGIAIALFSGLGSTGDDVVKEALDDALNGAVIGGMINICIIALLHSVSTMWQLLSLPSGKIFSDKLLRYSSIVIAAIANISIYYCIFVLILGATNSVPNHTFFRSNLVLFTAGGMWIFCELTGIILKWYRYSHCLDY